MAEHAVIALIRTHLERYPELDVLDVYKLLHQGVFGPGHSITNRKAAREWLEQEARISQPDKAAILVESVHPSGEVVRVHLRPYLAHSGSLNNLLDAYIKSGETVKGNEATLRDWWEAFAVYAKAIPEWAPNLDRRLILLTGRARAADGWPANHHSPRYEQSYKPVYRVLDRGLAEGILKQQRLDFSVR